MKKLPLFLATLLASLLNSCAFQWADYSKKVGVSRPKPEGRAVKLAFGAYDAAVYGNCVHFRQPPDLGLLDPQEVWVYNLDRDKAGTFDSMWIRPRGPESWRFYQNADLVRGSKAVPNSADPETFFDWIENAYQARSHVHRHRLQPDTPAARPAREPEPEQTPDRQSYEYKTYKRPGI